MKTKTTIHLTVDKRVVMRAKKYAKTNNHKYRSFSQLVEISLIRVMDEK